MISMPTERLPHISPAKLSPKLPGRSSSLTCRCRSTMFSPSRVPREHPVVLIFGLALSIGLMGVAASFIARLLQNHRWIAYAGLAVILYVALEMIYRGAHELRPVVKVIAGL